MAQAREAIETEDKDRSRYKAMDIIPLLQELQAKQAASRDMFNKEAAERLEQKGNIDGAGMTAQEILLAVARRTNEALIETQRNPSEARAATEREVIELLNIAIPKVKEREARLLHRTRGKAKIAGIIELYGLELFNPKNAGHQLNKLSLEAEGLTQISISLGTAWAYATPEMKALVKNKQADIAEELRKQERIQRAQGWNLIADGTISQALTSPEFRISPGTKLTLSRARTIDLGKIKITQEDCNTLIAAGISTPALMIYDSITAAAKAGGPYVIFTVREYMENRELKDEGAARDQILAAFEELGKLSYSFPRSKNPNLRVSIRETSDIEHGRAHFQLTTSFYSVIMRDKLLPMPVEAQKINYRKNPNTYHIIRRIQQNRSWNIGEPNENVISIPSLLERCPELPKYEDVMRKNRKLTQLIARPFMRDLEEARAAFYLELRGANGKPAPDPKAGGGWINYTYEEIQGLYVYSEPLRPEHPAQASYRRTRQLAQG